jgi:hypothetical protein
MLKAQCCPYAFPNIFGERLFSTLGVSQVEFYSRRHAPAFRFLAQQRALTMQILITMAFYLAGAATGLLQGYIYAVAQLLSVLPGLRWLSLLLKSFLPSVSYDSFPAAKASCFADRSPVPRSQDRSKPHMVLWRWRWKNGQSHQADTQNNTVYRENSRSS